MMRERGDGNQVGDQWQEEAGGGLLVPSEVSRKVVTHSQVREMLGISVPDLLDTAPPSPEIIARREQEFFASIKKGGLPGIRTQVNEGVLIAPDYSFIYVDGLAAPRLNLSHHTMDAVIFMNSELMGLRAVGLRLVQSIFVDTELSSSLLNATDARGSIIMTSRAQGTKVMGGNFSYSQWINADCRDMTFIGTNLRGAAFLTPMTDGMKFINCDTTDVVFASGAKLPEGLTPRRK